LANGAVGSAMTVEEFRILANTYGDLITDFSIMNGTAEYVEVDTIEIRNVEVVEGDLGFLSGALHWITALSPNGERDGKMEWSTLVTLRWRIDENGMITGFHYVSPEWQRQIFGVLLSLYASTRGPIENEMDFSGKMTLFGYNYFVVMIIAVISSMTTLLGMCVFVSIRCFESQGTETVRYNKVEVVTDTEME